MRKVPLAALVLAALAALLWLRLSELWLRPSEPNASPTIPGAPPGATAPQLESSAPMREASTPPHNPSFEPALATRRRAPVPLTRLCGRVVRDEDGTPIHDCAIRLEHYPPDLRRLAERLSLTEYLALDRTGPRNPIATQTDRDGHFEFRFVARPDRRPRLSVRYPDRVGLSTLIDEFEHGSTQRLGDIRLRLGSRVDGFVFDDERVPQPGVELIVYREGVQRDAVNAGFQVLNSLRCSSRGDGSFTLPAGLSPGRWKLHSARPLGSPHSFSCRARRPRLLQVTVLNKGQVRELSGRVMDESGAPIARATIYEHEPGLHWTAELNRVASAEDGRFRLLRRAADQGKETTLRVHKTGYQSLTVPELRWGESMLQLTLRACPRLRLVVTDEDGRPCERFRVEVVRRGHAFSQAKRYGIDHPGGTLQLTDLSARQWSLRVLSVGEPEFLSPVHHIDLPSEGASLPIRVFRRTGMRVIVQYRSGAPVPGARVEVIEPGTRPVRLSDLVRPHRLTRGGYMAGFPALLDQGLTDDTGELTLSAAATKPLTLRITGANSCATLVRDLPWRPELSPVRITTTQGAAVHGQLRPALPLQRAWEFLSKEHRTSPSASLTAHQRAYAPRIRFSRRSGGRHESRPLADSSSGIVSRDGRFSVAGLPPGTWSIALGLSHEQGNGRMRCEWQHLGTVHGLRSGETREFRAALDDTLPALVSGTIRINGAIAPHATLVCQPLRRPKRTAVRASTDAEGRFQIQLREGRWQLRVLARGLPCWLPGSLWELRPGERKTVQEKLRAASLELRLVAEDGKTALPGVPLRLCHEASAWSEWCAPSDARGICVFPCAPRALLEVQTRSAALAHDPASANAQGRRPKTDKSFLLRLGNVDFRRDGERPTLIVPRSAGY